MRYRTLLLTSFLIGGAVSAGEQVVPNGDLEDGYGQTAWTIRDSQNSVTLCNEPVCNTGGFERGPYDGDFWLWFGGISSGLEREQEVWQTIDIPVGATTLSYWMRTDTSGDVHRAELEISIDDDVVRAYPMPPLEPRDYELETVDIAAYADGAPHDLRFLARTDVGLGNTFWHIDSILITGCNLWIEPAVDRVRRGDRLPFRVTLHHHRLQTVTVPVLAELSDAFGQVVAAYESDPIEMSYRKTVERTFQIEIPDELRGNDYTLKVCVNRMSGNERLCRTAPIEVN